MSNTLTPATFDAMTGDRGRIIWTLGGIGQRIKRGPDFVRTLAEREGSPIRKEGRQYYAFEDELMAWMRKPHQC